MYDYKPWDFCSLWTRVENDWKRYYAQLRVRDEWMEVTPNLADEIQEYLTLWDEVQKIEHESRRRREMPSCDLFKPWDYTSVWMEQMSVVDQDNVEFYGRRRGSGMTMKLTEEQYDYIRDYWTLWHTVEQIERERHATG